MTIAAKLQIKPGQRVAVLHRPDGVDLELPADAPVVDDAGGGDAVILFVANRAELRERTAPVVAAARKDALSWIAYPKAGQRGTDLNRDSLNDALREHGVRAVRQVSIDSTWSALRFRPLEPGGS